MSKSIIPQNQLSLFDNVFSKPTDSNEEKQPIPLEVAKKWKFNLAHHIVDDNYWYAGQDWVAGVAIPKGRANETLRKIKARLEKDKVELRTQCTQLPYKASNGRIYQVDHFTDKGLYLITQRMEANTGVRNAVLEYLANAGVFVDAMRLNPELGVDFAVFAFAADGKSDVWIESRLMGKISRRFFMQHFFAVLKEHANYALATDNVYRGAFGFSTQALQRRLGITNPKTQELRDKLSVPALNALSTAEYLCGLRLSQYTDDEILPDEVVYATILEVAQAVGFENQETSKLMRDMGYDYLTGQPLLKKGHYEYE